MVRSTQDLILKIDASFYKLRFVSPSHGREQDSLKRLPMRLFLVRLVLDFVIIWQNYFISLLVEKLYLWLCENPLILHLMIFIFTWEEILDLVLSRTLCVLVVWILHYFLKVLIFQQSQSLKLLMIVYFKERFLVFHLSILRLIEVFKKMVVQA